MKHSSVMERGPSAWENWRAWLAGKPSEGAYEVVCYTDAHVTGAISEGLGPYQLLNTVPTGNRLGNLLPSIVLRLESHGENDSISPSALMKTDVSRYHGGSLGDELASLLSLSLGIRLRAGGYVREFPKDGDPRGTPWEFDHHRPYLRAPRHNRGSLLPGAADKVLLDDAVPLLTLYPQLPADVVITLVRAARSFQQALWVVDDDANLAWLSLVSAVEAAAGAWARASDTPEQRLRLAHPLLVRRLERTRDPSIIRDIAVELSDLTKSTAKFINFILAHLPDPPNARPAHVFQVDWTSNRLKRRLRLIYGHRSKALHEGIPLPGPML